MNSTNDETPNFLELPDSSTPETDVLLAKLDNSTMARNLVDAYKQRAQNLTFHARSLETRLRSALRAIDAMREENAGLREGRIVWLLRQIIDGLPTRRDWLDPEIEKESRLAIAQAREREGKQA